ncbi:SMI1/KNR4 family protein [Hymenobacter cellulosilyticus]|uniref:SMI1/KNR4 family protein n=1 Tax=Hymenobacter cellulosilyticus TaxID=2932248 RepID=A0A8T9QD83_9BACT|nr:SMI1/KNR4 family protein [Hymenobacter cellulosilyticus]UOQ75195.1 SMI1/KNR4 family protein [Hymenobacter cellulosilyticus]
MSQLLSFQKSLWKEEGIINSEKASEDDISIFNNNNDVLMPYELSSYFKEINGTSGDYDNKFFCFYSINNFKNIEDKFKEWDDETSFKKLSLYMANSKKYYVFADYQCHLIAYAVLIDKNQPDKNPVIAICGDTYKEISPTFMEFLKMYINDDEKIYLN